ncbi:AmmeMemoRadiSam system protein B [Telmatospirillum sp.]|uniref:AmmeMemoRadiSam system protein B n=1 Tax=Telmatospirillum sp. TaxID=2079197 RepID=UPI002849A303|nr:AmmeMemoRadiSam system protein B [Telmatospirillum sp.]MDR3441186.1 AmmeMemoRadiSam system protein B [Telmatospirillum sp.]
MGLIRNAAVAGLFYPAEAQVLTRDILHFLEEVPPGRHAAPKAIIAPHAGYVYSGPIAASVYARLRPVAGEISRVALFGPSHRVAFPGLAVPSVEAFETPLGRIPLDRPAIARLLQQPEVNVIDAAHAQEHSLEVHLPFLQTILHRFTLIPVVVGHASIEQVADAIGDVWGDGETLIVVSSDLSHYHDYDTARDMDSRTADAIERLDPESLEQDQACGRGPIAGLLRQAKLHGLQAETVDLRNSGDTAGPRDKVVGYGAWAFTTAGAVLSRSGEGSVETVLRRHASLLLGLARQAIAAGLRGDPPPAPSKLPPALDGPGASFVTLKTHGALRGCIGSPVAWRRLADDISNNAVKAAFEDPRFPPLTASEWAALDISLSILTPPQPMQFADQVDLLRQLRPREDGLIIEDAGHRALFLPSVWEQLPDPESFLAHLKRKAGLAPQHWSATFAAQRFQAVEITDADIDEDFAEED